MKPNRQPPLLPAIAAGLIVFVLHACSPITQSGDSRWSVPVMLRMLTSGDANLDEFVSLWQPDTLYGIDCIGPRGEVRKAGLCGCAPAFHAYPHYPLATPLLTLPLFWVLQKVAPLVPPVTPALDLLHQRRYLQVHRLIEIFLAAAIVGLSAIFVFLLAGRGAQAWFWTLAYAFGTSAWSTASRALWQHGMSLLLLTAALWLLRQGNRRTLLAGVLLGLACWNRHLNAIPLLCLAAWLGRDAWRLFAGAGAVSLPFLAFNLWVYRSPVQPYFQPQGLFVWEAQRLAGVLLGQTLSPGRGLLVYSPFLILTIAGAAKLWPKERGLVLALLSWGALHWLAISLFGDWAGGIGYGPRYWTEWLPAAMVLTSAVWPARPWVWALVAWSVFVHGRGALDARTQSWNQRWVAGQTSVWDWKGAPFL